MNSSQFRYDINGLRALSVIAVVVFHYNNTWLSGGFTGVDIFFVISGYLMTAIIYKKLNNHSFSILQFYQARAKRIIPALLAICSILLIIGYLLFEPMTYQLIGKHAFSSLLFFSNFIYYTESGYFDVDSQSKFLLHTWSLSVEWQFYIIYPILLIALYKFFQLKQIKFILCGLALVSFFLNLYCVTYYPTFAFFMLPTRIWELLIGGIAFFQPISIPKKGKIWIELFCILTIILSFYFIPAKSVWSGYLTCIPVIATYICIINYRQNTILSHYIIQKIGLVSYSIYLVHWPILVFYKILNIHLSLHTYVPIIFMLTLILYYTIESKRNYHYKTLFTYFIPLAASIFISINGAAYRIANPIYRMDHTDFFVHYYGGIGIPSNSQITHFNNDGKSPSFILIGDSHARQYGQYLRDNHFNFIGTFNDGCIAFPDFYIDSMRAPHDTTTCPKHYAQLQELLQKYPTTNLVIIQRWDVYGLFPLTYYDKNFPNQKKMIFDAFEDEFKLLIQLGGNQRNYFIVGRTFDNYEEENIFQCFAKQELYFYKKILPLTCNANIQYKPVEINTILADIVKNISHQYPNIHFIDPNVALCTSTNCHLVDKDNNPILSDIDHLSTYGANIAGKYIWQQINKTK